MNEQFGLNNLENILRDLIKNPEIKHASIVSMEGLPIISILPRGMEEAKISAITATLLSLTERTIVEMKKGDFNYLLINANEGNIFIFQAGMNAVLTISTKKEAKIGLILLEANRAVENIINFI